MQYSLKAFGLNIQSDFPFRGIITDEKGFFDVKVLNKTVPENLEHVTFKGLSMESNHTEFLLKVPNVANFLITEGKTIHIDPSPLAEQREIELFFLGSAMAVVLMQRGIIPFHGSAFEKDGKAIIISGTSGAGKSSLLRFFLNEGYKALTDDVCALSIEDDKVIITPSFPSSKIWEDVMDVFSLEKSAEKQLRPSINKYRIDFEEQLADYNLEVESIYILRSLNLESFSLKKVQGFEKFKILKQNLYRPKFPEATGKEKESFITLNKLAQQANLFELFRSKNIEMLDAFNQYAKQKIID